MSRDFSNNTNTNFYNSNNEHFCNNCGKLGHSFHQCKQPITSVGLIVFTGALPSVALARRQNSLDSNLPISPGVATGNTLFPSTTLGTEPPAELFLMIRRKDSIGYVEFMRGKYPMYNKLYIQNIISEMTEAEKNKILNNTFDTLWRELWGDNLGIQYRGEEKAARDKFEFIKTGIHYDKNTYSFKTLVDECSTHWNETEWGFPKGRHNHQEKDLLCALREFEEETGYSRNSIKLVQNLLPFEEIFTGSNYKSYKHKYYLAYMENVETDVLSFQKSEVSKMEWKTFDAAMESIRPYNLEKKDVLIRVNKLLSDYRLYP